MSLHDRWLATLDLAGLGPAAELWRDVATRYREEHRAYHTHHHIAACFNELDALGPAAKPVRDPSSQRPGSALELAIFFHDVIYDPRASDNEEASAVYAERQLAKLGAPESLCTQVSRLVLVTKHDAAPATADEQLLVDIDLSILGTEPSTFDVYEREVRQEYAFVPEASFRAGRAAILEAIASRVQIYSTPQFQSRYELRARQNLARSVASLRTKQLSRSVATE